MYPDGSSEEPGTRCPSVPKVRDPTRLFPVVSHGTMEASGISGDGYEPSVPLCTKFLFPKC